MKRIHKTIHTLQILHYEITGLLYDIKELVTSYRGNLIILCVGIAVTFFNYNRPNAGMLFQKFFLLMKRFTVKYNSETSNGSNESTFEETTTGLSPTNVMSEGIFMFFADAMQYLRDRLFH